MYLPLEKGVALHLNKLKSPLLKDALCQVWLKLAKWFWNRRWKCEKLTDRQTDGQTTDRKWSEKLTWAFSSGELKRPYECTIMENHIHGVWSNQGLLLRQKTLLKVCFKCWVKTLICHLHQLQAIYGPISILINMI